MFIKVSRVIYNIKGNNLSLPLTFFWGRGPLNVWFANGRIFQLGLRLSMIVKVKRRFWGIAGSAFVFGRQVSFEKLWSKKVFLKIVIVKIQLSTQSCSLNFAYHNDSRVVSSNQNVCANELNLVLSFTFRPDNLKFIYKEMDIFGSLFYIYHVINLRRVAHGNRGRGRLLMAVATRLTKCWLNE